MYKLTVLNMTTAAIEQSDELIRLALYLELFLLFTGLFETSFLWYLLRYTSQYHRNLAMIVEQLPNQYIPSIFVRMFIIYMQLTITDTEVLIENSSFLVATWLRNTLLFVAFYFSSFPVFERVFATYFMQDYAKNKRRWISYMLIIFLYCVSIISSQLFIFGATGREFHIFLIIIFNIVAFALTFVVEIYNKKRYFSLRNSNSYYTLSVRFQLSENLSSTKSFKVMCFSIIFFASLCTTMLSVDEYTENPRIRNWVYIAFNYCCWFYGAIVPVVMYRNNIYWQKEIKRLIKMMKCTRQVNPTTEQKSKLKKTQVRDTFGNNCLVDDTKQTDVYFSQLTADWAHPKEAGKEPQAATVKKLGNSFSATIQSLSTTPR